MYSYFVPHRIHSLSSDGSSNGNITTSSGASLQKQTDSGSENGNEDFSSPNANAHKRTKTNDGTKRDVNPRRDVLTPAKITALTQIPVSILKAFNGGDIPKVKEIVKDVTLKNCAIKTPSLDNDLFGQNYISDFFEAVYESHPDAVWVAKKSKFVTERNEVSARIYFAGTRIAQASKGTDLSGAYSEHLFKKRGSSLLDEMDVSLLTESEIGAMKELENLGCNLSVFGKGSMTLLVDEETGKISKFSIEWVITSFRQAAI